MNCGQQLAGRKMPKIRLSNPELYALKGILVGTGKSVEWALTQLGIAGILDDPSEQTLETLIFKCYECDRWRGIEESDPTAPGACMGCLESAPEIFEDEVYTATYPGYAEEYF